MHNGPYDVGVCDDVYIVISNTNLSWVLTTLRNVPCIGP